MPPRITTPKSKKIAGELRKSQTITTFGCGALVDFPRFSGIIAGTDEWTINKCTKLSEPNLQKLLGVDCLYEVCDSAEDDEYGFFIPAYRFPEWYYCPKCGRLDRYKKISKPTTGNTTPYNGDLFCNYCEGKVKLVPSRFITACLNGHIHDFPYVWWTHKGQGICDNPRLKLEYAGTTGGLDSIHLKCETCGAENTMANCLGKESLKGIPCNGEMPWLGKGDDGFWYKDQDRCTASIRALQRSANNVYYSVNQSALTIPPFSKKMLSVFKDTEVEFLRDTLNESEDLKKMLHTKIFNKYKEVFRNDFSVFEQVVNLLTGDSEEEQQLDVKGLREIEYRALTGPAADSRDDYCFRTTSQDVPDEFRGLISQIKMVTKLREVMVLQGFRRILPDFEGSEEEKQQLGISKNFAPISKNPSPKWLPATQLFGEGIFIEFDEDAVSKWELQNKERYQMMADNHKQSWIGNEMFDHDKPRYVLLHTFAHLFIRQLASQCGYATASIREKIYSTYKDRESKMCGILIYTSSADADGSLGGLVREGMTDRIRDTILALLETASWCSNDPICIESKAQGYKSLNYASCHACTLLPETSCEAFNCLLDRASIVGTPDDKDISFFKELL